MAAERPHSSTSPAGGEAAAAETIWFSAPLRQDERLVFKLQRGDFRDEIYFTVPLDFFAHSDCMATALAALCGKQYSELHFDFPVSTQCGSAIGERTGARVTSSGTCPPRKSGKAIALNFSGGFDSMAAYYLAPDEQLRVSVDFRGKYAREREFFETLSPDVLCATDFREKRYDRGDWMFMGAVSFLFADYLDLEAIGYGTIFEAGPANYRLKPKRPDDALIKGIGLYDATLTRGLTEFGTAMVMDTYAPDLVQASIRSLAPDGTEKQLRKRLLIDTVRHRLGGPTPRFDTYSYPSRKVEFGKSYALDFLALLFARLYGREEVGRWMSGFDGIGDQELAALDVSWIFRFNTHYEQEIPGKLRAGVAERLARAGIEPFSEGDWPHYAGVRNTLARFHKFPG